MWSIATPHRLMLAASVIVLVLAGVVLLHDLPAVLQVLQDFRWSLLVPAFACSAGMHLLRMFRWHLWVRAAAGRRLRTRDSLLIYVAGLGTHLTPGRVGEAVRCVFLKRAAGTPIARSAPIILAERVLDAAALLALALPGAILLGLGGPAAVALLLAPMLLVPLLAWRRTYIPVLALARRTPLLRRIARPLDEAAGELRGFLTPRMLVPTLFCSLAGTFLEVATFAIVLDGLGVALTSDAILRAAFVLPVAMLATGIFIVPGNLGVAEGGIATLTRSILSVPAAAAAGAAILVRFVTLWLGLLVGFAALALATRRWGRASLANDSAPAKQSDCQTNIAPGSGA